MKQITVKIYQFEELSQDAQEKALNWWREDRLDSEWWDYDGKLDLSSQELKDRKMSKLKYDTPFEYENMYFSLDRNYHIQFDGIEIPWKGNGDEIARRFLRIPKALWEKCLIEFENVGRNPNTKMVINHYNDADFTARELQIVENAEEIFNEKVLEALENLRENYDYLMSDEAVKKSIICNEYEFLEDGSRY